MSRSYKYYDDSFDDSSDYDSYDDSSDDVSTSYNRYAARSYNRHYNDYNHYNPHHYKPNQSSNNYYPRQRDRRYYHQYQHPQISFSSHSQSNIPFEEENEDKFIENCINRHTVPLLYCLSARDKATGLYFVKIGMTNHSVEYRVTFIPLDERSGIISRTWCCKEDLSLAKIDTKTNIEHKNDPTNQRPQSQNESTIQSQSEPEVRLQPQISLQRQPTIQFASQQTQSVNNTPTQSQHSFNTVQSTTLQSQPGTQSQPSTTQSPSSTAVNRRPSLYHRKSQQITVNSQNTQSQSTECQSQPIQSFVETASIPLHTTPKPSLYRKKPLALANSSNTNDNNNNNNNNGSTNNSTIVQTISSPTPAAAQRPSLYRRKSQTINTITSKTTTTTTTTTATSTSTTTTTTTSTTTTTTIKSPEPRPQVSSITTPQQQPTFNSSAQVKLTSSNQNPNTQREIHNEISRERAAFTITDIEKKFLDICHADYPHQAQRACQVFTWGGKSECVYVSHIQSDTQRAFQAIVNRINFLYRNQLVETNYRNPRNGHRG